MSLIGSNKYNVAEVYDRGDITLEERLINAIREGDVLKVRNLVVKGADVNYKNEVGFTPLMYSAVTGINSITKILLKAGSNIEETNKRGLTALALALFNGSYEVYDTLCEANANKEIINKLRLVDKTLEDGQKYTPIDIIKREIYCENDDAKKLITKMLNNISTYGDERIELVMTCIALHTMEKDFTEHNLKIFVTDNIDTSVFTGTSLENGYLLGAYNIVKNTIQTSNFGGDFMATSTLLHELTHKVHLACGDLKLEKLNDAVNEVKDRLKKFPKTKGSEYIEKNMIERIEGVGNYDKLALQLLEYLADPISYGIIRNKYKNDVRISKPMEKILAPIYKVFDEEISMELKQYILDNKNFSKLELSDRMKKSLREFKNMRRAKNDKDINKGINMAAFTTGKSMEIINPRL